MSDPLSRLRFLIGEWDGEISGRPGSGEGRRAYTTFDHFIEFTDRSTYEPQEDNPAGEVHRELGVFSYDENRAVGVLREFHSEGFVITYEMQMESDSAIVFDSTAFENGPPDLRARLTITPRDDGSFDEMFELASSGNPYACYISSRWSRIPD